MKFHIGDRSMANPNGHMIGNHLFAAFYGSANRLITGASTSLSSWRLYCEGHLFSYIKSNKQLQAVALFSGESVEAGVSQKCAVFLFCDRDAAEAVGTSFTATFTLCC